MKPLDPRLLRYAHASRAYVLLTAGFGLATAAAVVAQAFLLARATAPVITGEADLGVVAPLIGWLAAVFVARIFLVAAQERYAHRAAARVVGDLRAGVVDHAISLGPRWLAEGNAATVTTLATRGLDALEPYFVRYLPQLLLAVTVTPTVLVVIAGLDLVAAVTIAVTIPLIPVFMLLVGRLTQHYAAERLAVMQRLGAQVLDLLAGLTTLKALGRERGPGARVRQLGDSYRRTTMQTLRVAFLSGAVLELLATLAVALVAVGVGLRLVFGELDLTTGLVVIMLAPEVYLPLRQVGTHFHASADGIAAAQKAFAVLDAQPPAAGTATAPDLRSAAVAWRDVSVRSPGRDSWAPYGLTATVRPGRVVALAGPSGAGKTTAALVLLGLIMPDRGSVIVTPDRDTTTTAPKDVAESCTLPDIDPHTWWAQIAWVPQRPLLLPGTVRENLLAIGGFSGPDPQGAAAETRRDEDLARAAATVGFDRVVDSLPGGWDTVIGQGGVGLSLGQRQRLALTRALLGGEPLVVLDEPTAHLDAESESQVIAGIRELARAGRTVVVIAHRRAVLDVADDVVLVRSAEPSKSGDTRSDAPSSRGDALPSRTEPGNQGAPVRGST